MSLPRKPGLGRYNCTRDEWRQAYRAARLLPDNARQQSIRVPSIQWKAGLIVANDRSAFCDPLSMPLQARLLSKQIIDEIVGAE